MAKPKPAEPTHAVTIHLTNAQHRKAKALAAAEAERVSKLAGRRITISMTDWFRSLIDAQPEPRK
jgi:hypothetical protein